MNRGGFLLALWVASIPFAAAHDFGEALEVPLREQFLELNGRVLVTKAQERLVFKAQEHDRLLGPLLRAQQLTFLVREELGRRLSYFDSGASHDQAWFDIGKRRWREGKPEEALAAWNKLSPNVAPTLRAETALLEAIYRSATGDAKRAEQLMQSLRAGDINELGKLNQLIVNPRRTAAVAGPGSVDVWTREADPVLRDRALVTAGVLDIRNKEYDRALGRLRQVRIHGPYANTALLATGWIHYLRKDYARALVPWVELQQRPPSDPRVWAAMPYLADVWWRLGDERQALVTHFHALETFREQIRVLDRALESLKAGGVILAIKEKHLGEGLPEAQDWVLPEIFPADRDEVWFLDGIISQHAYNEGYRNFRRLSFLRQYLSYLKADLAVYQEVTGRSPEAYPERMVAQRAYVLRQSVAGPNEFSYQWVFQRPLAAGEKAAVSRVQGRALSGVAPPSWLGGQNGLMEGLQRWSGHAGMDRQAVEVSVLGQGRRSAVSLYGGHRQILGEIGDRTAALSAEIDQALMKELRFLGDVATRHFRDKRHQLERYLLRVANEIDAMRQQVGRRKGAY